MFVMNPPTLGAQVCDCLELNQPTEIMDIRTMMMAMMLTLSILPCAFAENYADPHQYIETGLSNWKQVGSDGKTTYQFITEKLLALKGALPTSEDAFKAKIDAGIAALNKMRDNLDDSKLDDLALMGAEFARYYRANKAALDADPQGALTLAFNAFDGGNPPRYFEEHLIGNGFLYSYIHAYVTMEKYNVPMPQYAKAAMVESLEWVTPQNDGEQAGLNETLVYYFGAMWNLVSPKLATMDATQRELVLDELEIALVIEKANFGEAIGIAAETNLATARLLYPEVPDQ